MANSANYATNLQDLPSIFEIHAAEFLDKLLYPALDKVLPFLSDKYFIQKYNNSINFGNIAPVIVVALQYLYLKKRGGSLGECFYGLERTLNPGQRNNGSNKEFISAISLTLIPYCEKILKGRNVQHHSSKFENVLLRSLNIFNIIKSMYTLTYLAKITTTHSPIFQFLKLKIQYNSTPTNDKLTIWILKSIEIFAFFLQFTQWWYGNNQNMKVGKLINPKPSDITNINVDGTMAGMNGKCPICLQEFKNPTASGISGYVYCWKCIVSHLKTSKSCPITEYPMDIDDLVRIYDQ